MANGNGVVNGSVLVPKWVVGIFCMLLSALVAWGIQDRRSVGMEIDQLRERVARIEGTRFREADGLRMEQRLRGYIDMRIREIHGGGP